MRGARQRLISRGLYRLTPGQRGRIRFELHPNAYRFGAGTRFKLELLGRDAPYAQAPQRAFSVRVQRLRLVAPDPRARHPGVLAMSDDYGDPISYQALQRGTPIVSSDTFELGTVERVIDNAKEHIFDGIVMRTDDGLLWVDAPGGRAHHRAPRDAHDRRSGREAAANGLRAGSPRVPRQRARGAPQPLLRRRLEAALTPAPAGPRRRSPTAARAT